MLRVSHANELQSQYISEHETPVDMKIYWRSLCTDKIFEAPFEGLNFYGMVIFGGLFVRCAWGVAGKRVGFNLSSVQNLFSPYLSICFFTVAYFGDFNDTAKMAFKLLAGCVLLL